MYGKKMTSRQLRRFLEHVFDRNSRIGESNRLSTPIMIWGNHGLGKTQLVTEYAREKGWGLAYCAPAQFEEMGDLHGIPTLVDPDKTIIGDEYMVYSPPEWSPKTEGPGILLLDDLNRADDRILRGTMQLLQNFELMSWSLPPKWQIVCTANPEDEHYSVTPMDDAMLTRLLHTTMIFDAPAWAGWASESGVDQRCIDFVLTYPESITGRRTTPRSITQFFLQIQEIESFKTEIDLVEVLALSALDDVTVATFMNFINDDLEKLISPQDILEAKPFGDVKKRIIELSRGKDGAIRLDRLGTICTRLFIHLTAKDYTPQDQHGENIVAFLKIDELPNDLKMSLYMDVQREAGPEVREMLKDKRLAELLLATM